MKRFFLTISISGLLLSVSTPFAVLAARSRELALGSVTIKRLGVEEPAILATNPFYWMTDLGQGMRETFASGKAQKLLVRAETLNRKAAEFLKIRSVAGTNQKALSKAATEHQLAAYQLLLAVSKISASDVSERALRSLLQNAVLNVRLTDDLLAADENAAERIVLIDTLDRILESAVRLALLSGNLSETLVGLGYVDAPVIERIRFAEVFNMIAKRAAGSQDRISQEFLAARTILLDSFASELKAPSTDAPVPTMKSFAVMEALVEQSAPEAPGITLRSELVSSLDALAGTPAERSATISYLLSLPEFATSRELIDLKNEVLMKVFAR